MGIEGLLPALKEKKIIVEGRISQFANESIAIDAYGLLHKGAIAVATELASDVFTRG